MVIKDKVCECEVRTVVCVWCAVLRCAYKELPHSMTHRPPYTTQTLQRR